MTTYDFPCGCKIPVINDTIKKCDGLPSLRIPYDDLVRDLNYSDGCIPTWDLVSTGHTKGIFQLETNLGHKWAKDIQPHSLEDMSALVSLMRPGCVAGDTKVIIRKYNNRKSNGGSYVKIKIKDLYEQWNRDNHKWNRDIISIDEKENIFVPNTIENVMCNGIKDTYKVNVKTRKRNTDSNGNGFDLECTLDHKLLTHDRGWIELQNLEIGERIAVFNNTKTKSKHTKNIKGEKTFRDICFLNYKYKCIFCDWNEGSIDVNHLEGNRKTNNHPDNLCFMCPNHHRMYTEGNISKEECIEAREQYKLNNTEDIIWAEYSGKDFVGKKQVFDITCENPHHSFVAGNVVVHNCLRAIVDGKSMTQHYSDRKAGLEEVEYFHSALEPILSSTYGVMTYQEQAMKIAVGLAGFNEQEADVLRKAIGKKKADIMAKVKDSFLAGCARVGIVTEKEAEEIFGWIQESQKYSFNKSHGVSYGSIGYLTAFVKFHFPLHFYCSWLQHARSGANTQDEVKGLINDAKLFDIRVKSPSIKTIYENNSDICMSDGDIYFGIRCIKKIGKASMEKLLKTIENQEDTLKKDIREWTWMEYLIYLLGNVGSTTVNGLISAGLFDHLKIPRKRLIHEYQLYGSLTTREKGIILDRMDDTLSGMITGIASRDMKNDGASKNRKPKLLNIAKMLLNPPKSVDEDPRWTYVQEKELLGVPITYNQNDIRSNNMATNATCKEFMGGRQDDMIMAVEITNVREHITKSGSSKGSPMGFATVEDETGSIDCVIFTDNWVKFKDELFKGNTVVIQGKRSDRDSFIINKIFPF